MKANQSDRAEQAEHQAEQAEHHLEQEDRDHREDREAEADSGTW